MVIMPVGTAPQEVPPAGFTVSRIPCGVKLIIFAVKAGNIPCVVITCHDASVNAHIQAKAIESIGIALADTGSVNQRTVRAELRGIVCAKVDMGMVICDIIRQALIFS